jgi:hypothetical protein
MALTSNPLLVLGLTDGVFVAAIFLAGVLVLAALLSSSIGER